MKLGPLYPILDVEMAAARGHDLVGCARGFADLGIEVQQVRAKTLPAAELLRMAERLQAVVPTLIVNDRADVALLAGAAGVHLGQTDLPAAAARKLGPPDWIVGISTHNPEQAAIAADSAPSYLALGPIFPTSSKAARHFLLGSLPLVARSAGFDWRQEIPVGAQGIFELPPLEPDPVVGVQAVCDLRSEFTGALVAIGGIALANCASVWRAGADAVAVISALWQAPDPVQAAREFLLAFKRVSCHSPGD